MLLNEIVSHSENVENPGDTVFARLLRELQAYQMETELQNHELREAGYELEDMRKRCAELYDFAPLAYFTFDLHGSIREANLAAARLLCQERDSLLGASFIEFLARHTRSNFLSCVRACISGNEKSNAEFDIELPGGKAVLVQVASAVALLLPDNVAACRIAFADVTEQRIIELKLRLTAKVMESTQEGIILTDAQRRIVAANPVFLKTTGYDSDEIIGFTPSMFKSGLHDEQFYREMNESFLKNDGWQGKIWNRRKNGETFQEWANIKVIRKNNGEVDCYLGLFSDLSNLEEMKKKLNELAYYDELTGLANRSLLYDRLQQAVVQSRRFGTGMAVLFMDLDHFKQVNDNHGHETGDQVIKEAADRLTFCLREGDTLSRLGGDEFVAILPNIAGRDVPAQIADRMVKVLQKPFLVDDDELHVTTSVGISVFPDDGDEVAVLLKNADAAMYRAKGLGRSNYQFHDSTSR